MKNNNEMALLYNFDQTEKGRKVKFALIQMGIRIKNVSKEQFNQPIGGLCGLKEYPLLEEEYNGDGFTEEMLVMKGMGTRRIDELILKLRKNKVEKIQLKAIITPSNQGWDSVKLFEELKKENKEMTDAIQKSKEKKQV